MTDRPVDSEWPERERWITLAALVLVPLVLGVLVYQSFLGLWFWTDDFIWLRTAAESDANVAFKEAFTYPRGASPFWRPLVDLYFFTMYELFPLNATMYHIATLAIHVATGTLLGLLALRLTKSVMIAALASGLFVISPTYSTMIPWATGVTAALSGLFSVIMALVFLRWLDGGSRRWLIFALLALAGALLSKEDAAALPAVLVLMTLAVKQPRRLRDFRGAALLVLPLIALWLAYALPQFVAVIGSDEASRFSFGWHVVPRLGIAMSWVSLPFPLSYAGWVDASRWAALGVFTLVALVSALRRAWLLPALYLAAVAMLLPSSFLTGGFAPRWTYHASLPWAIFIAITFVGAYRRLSALNATVGLVTGILAAAFLIAVLSGRTIDSQAWVAPLSDEYRKIERTITGQCTSLAEGKNVYLLRLPIGGSSFGEYAVPELAQMKAPGVVVHRIRPESLLDAPSPRAGDCVLFWNWVGQYKGTSVGPGREGFSFWVSPGAENLLTGEEPMTAWRAELADTGDGLAISSSSEEYGVLFGEIESEKNLTYIAYAWVKAALPTDRGTVTITLGQSTGVGPRNASASFNLTDTWQQIAVYRRTLDAVPGTLSLAITRDVGVEQQSSFLVKDATVVLFAIQSPTN